MPVRWRTIAPYRCARRARLGGLWLGLASVFITKTICVAQHGTGLAEIRSSGPYFPPELKSMPLTVRPGDMTLGTKTSQAGDIVLDSARGIYLYVPRQCVGTARCPLVLALHPAGATGRDIINEWRARSDRHGLIVLAPTSPSSWQLVTEKDDHANVDAALKRVLVEFAIDVTKMAIGGFSASGGGAMAFGGYRTDLFNRMILASTDFSIGNLDPKNKRMRIFLSSGIGESKNHFLQLVALRQRGQSVEHTIDLRPHGGGAKAKDIIGNWLSESWAPAKSRPAAPAFVVAPLPLLTPAIVQKMAAFWKAFLREPDSIRTDARAALARKVLIPVGKERAYVWMVNMPVLAAKHPSVAAALKAAGLTARQHDAYRAALVGARIAQYTTYGSVIDRVVRSSVKPGQAAFDSNHVGQGDLIDALGGDTLRAIIARAFDSINVLDSLTPPPVVIDPASISGRNLRFAMAHKEQLSAEFQEMWLTP